MNTALSDRQHCRGADLLRPFRSASQTGAASLRPYIIAGAMLLTANAVFAAAAMNPMAPAAAKEALPPGAEVASLEVTPASIKLDGCFDAAQLVVSAVLSN